MEIASALIFAAGVVLLFWSLFAVFSPRLLRLRNMWRVAALSGFAIVLLMAGTNLNPANDTPEDAFTKPALFWVALCALVIAGRKLAQAHRWRR